MDKKQVKNIVEYIDLDKLNLLENNPRTITDKSFEILKASIKNNPDYFEARPLIVSDRTGKLVVLAGNQRLRASIELGLTQAPCVVLHNLDEETEAEIIVRDNVELGEWDFELLANEWSDYDLSEWGVKEIDKYLSVDENIDDIFGDDIGEKEKSISDKTQKVVCPFCEEEFDL